MHGQLRCIFPANCKNSGLRIFRSAFLTGGEIRSWPTQLAMRIEKNSLAWDHRVMAQVAWLGYEFSTFGMSDCDFEFFQQLVLAFKEYDRVIIQVVWLTSEWFELLDSACQIVFRIFSVIVPHLQGLCSTYGNHIIGPVWVIFIFWCFGMSESNFGFSRNFTLIFQFNTVRTCSPSYISYLSIYRVSNLLSTILWLWANTNSHSCTSQVFMRNLEIGVIHLWEFSRFEHSSKTFAVCVYL
jgi:hypothetical protein